jgi:hypothetical protein
MGVLEKGIAFVEKASAPEALARAPPWTATSRFMAGSSS